MTFPTPSRPPSRSRRSSYLHLPHIERLPLQPSSSWTSFLPPSDCRPSVHILVTSLFPSSTRSSLGFHHPTTPTVFLRHAPPLSSFFPLRFPPWFSEIQDRVVLRSLRLRLFVPPFPSFLPASSSIQSLISSYPVLPHPLCLLLTLRLPILLRILFLRQHSPRPPFSHTSGLSFDFHSSHLQAHLLRLHPFAARLRCLFPTLDLFARRRGEDGRTEDFRPLTEAGPH